MSFLSESYRLNSTNHGSVLSMIKYTCKVDPPKRDSTMLSSFMKDPSIISKIQRPKISIADNRENSIELKIHRSNSQLKRELSINNKHFSEASSSNLSNKRLSDAPRINRDIQYKNSYKGLSQIFLKMPRMENTMKNTQITAHYRGKMVNWMVEVFEIFKDKSTNETFFRAVLIMDMFIKHYQEKVLNNTDVYIIGLSCIFISSKYTDLDPITLQQFEDFKFLEKHPKEKILEFEFTILRTIGFEIYFPIVTDFLDYHIDLFVGPNQNEFNQRLVYFCVLILKICALNVEFNDLTLEKQSLSVILFVLRYVSCAGEGGHQSLHFKVMRISTMATEIEKKVLETVGKKLNIMENQVLNLKTYVLNYLNRNQGSGNLMKFNQKYKLRLLEKR